MKIHKKTRSRVGGRKPRSVPLPLPKQHKHKQHSSSTCINERSIHWTLPLYFPNYNPIVPPFQENNSFMIKSLIRIITHATTTTRSFIIHSRQIPCTKHKQPINWYKKFNNWKNKNHHHPQQQHPYFPFDTPFPFKSLHRNNNIIKTFFTMPTIFKILPTCYMNYGN